MEEARDEEVAEEASGERYARRSLQPGPAIPAPGLPRPAAGGSDPDGVRPQEAGHRRAGVGAAAARLVDPGPAVSRLGRSHSRHVSSGLSEPDFDLGAGSWAISMFSGSSTTGSQSRSAICSLRSWLSSILAAIGRPCCMRSWRMVWLFVVWGICGGAICRIAVVRVARHAADRGRRGDRLFLSQRGVPDPGALHSP